VDGNSLSEVDFHSDEVRRRITNTDETHHDQSITGEKGGLRVIDYSNPNLQRGYRKTVKVGRHTRPTPLEKLFLHSTYLIRVQRLNRITESS
jgi:hypothetical protein